MHDGLRYTAPMRIFVAYRDSPERRRALASPLGHAERYRLYALDELTARGHDVRHNLESLSVPAWARGAGAATKRVLEAAGGFGGDFSTVAASFRQANRADVVLSTVDTVGIPLMLSRRAVVLRSPLVYTAIGLPERLARIRSERMRRLYAGALARCAAIVAYSQVEIEDIRGFLADHGEATRVEFVPFGVDQNAFLPSVAEPALDVVSVGADHHRDVDLFIDLAVRTPNRSFRLVTTRDRTQLLPSRPDNLEVEADISLDDVIRRLRSARVVALPVLDNSYSGATTVLLQAMALGKPVVVTRTRAIADGYGLVDGENCRLVEPGDADAFARALADVLRDEWHARALGARARRTVEEGLTWARYADRIEAALRGAFEARAGARSALG
jgi:glycosyltransferase involved in cell wall biosynthesis